jgi:hypothetical protein
MATIADERRNRGLSRASLPSAQIASPHTVPKKGRSVRMLAGPSCDIGAIERTAMPNCLAGRP